MKHLSLLLLLSLTTNCFAHQKPTPPQPDEHALCWQLVEKFWSESGERDELIQMGAMEDCLARRKEIAALLADKKFTSPGERQVLKLIKLSQGTLQKALRRKAKHEAQEAPVCGGPKAPCPRCPKADKPE